jgi:hypothetical protein
MRRLSILVLALGVTSTAWAGPVEPAIWPPVYWTIEPVFTSYNGETIEPTQEIVAGFSDVLGFDLYYYRSDNPVLMSLDALVRIDGPGTLDVGPDPVGGNHLTWPYNEGFNNWAWDVVGTQGAVATAAFMGMGEGVLVDHFLLHYEGEGGVIINVLPNNRWGGTILIDGVTAYSGDWGTATIVPEPTTIALFGIVGLALLRRRRR